MRRPLVLGVAGALVLLLLAFFYARSLDTSSESPARQFAGAQSPGLAQASPEASPPAAPSPAVVSEARTPPKSPGPRTSVNTGRVSVVDTAGTLELTVAPSGEVFIDGKSRGQQSGTVKYDLTPGEHQLDIKGAIHWGPKTVSVVSHKVTAQSAWIK